MKILIVSQYFWPENFRINEIALNFREKGHEVEVLTGIPNYPIGSIFQDYNKNPNNYDFYKGIKIYRMNIATRGKGSKYDIFKNYISFFIKALFFSFFKLRYKNYDIIFSFGTSPVTTSIIPIFLSKFTNSKTAIWVLDLWPEIVFELNIINTFYSKYLFSNLMNFIYNKNDIVFGQSLSFVNKLKNKVKKKDKVKELNAWPEEINTDFNYKPSFVFDKNSLNIVFTGNIGVAQNFEYISKIMKKLNNLKIKWHIVGSGRYLLKMQKDNIGSKNIYYYGYRDKSEIFQFLKNADVLLISLKEGESINATIPGKFQTYLLAEKPILGSIDGEVARLVKENNIGLVSKPGDEEVFIKNIKYFLRMKEKQETFEANTRLLQEKFSKDNIMNFLNNEIINETKKFQYLNLIYDIDDINLNNNFILSAINLAWLGYFSKGEIKIDNKFIFWPDGLFYRKIYKNKKTKKIPGRELIKKLNLNDKIKVIHVVGNISENGKKYLSEYYKNKKIKHTNLSYDKPKNLIKLIPELRDDEITLLTLPTPKQEQIALLLKKKNKTYKIICLGGAIRMLCGDEPPAPNIIYKLNLEFLWRLRYETKRRVKRLIESFYFFLKAEIKGKFRNLKEKN